MNLFSKQVKKGDVRTTLLCCLFLLLLKAFVYSLVVGESHSDTTTCDLSKDLH